MRKADLVFDKSNTRSTPAIEESSTNIRRAGAASGWPPMSQNSIDRSTHSPGNSCQRHSNEDRHKRRHPQTKAGRRVCQSSQVLSPPMEEDWEGGGLQQHSKFYRQSYSVYKNTDERFTFPAGSWRNQRLMNNTKRTEGDPKYHHLSVSLCVALMLFAHCFQHFNSYTIRKKPYVLL